jgi:hypothetical protein
MPRYFINTRNAGQLIEDPEGEEQAELSLAIEAAVDSAREAMIERLKQHVSADGHGSQMEVADDNGGVLAVVEFNDVLKGRY